MSELGFYLMCQPPLNKVARVNHRRGESWYIAAHITDALGIPPSSIGQHCTNVEIHAPKRPPKGVTSPCAVISVQDVYRLVVKADSPEAETVQDWLYEHYIPSVRELGHYREDYFVFKNQMAKFEAAIAQLKRAQEAKEGEIIDV